MSEKVIICGMCLATYRHAEVDNKYMKNYDPKKELSYLILGRKKFIPLDNITKVAC